MKSLGINYGKRDESVKGTSYGLKLIGKFEKMDTGEIIDLDMHWVLENEVFMKQNEFHTQDEFTGALVRLPDLKRKTLGKKGINCIFVGYAEHSKAYRFYVIEPNDSVPINLIIESRDAISDENHFSSIPRPKDIIPNVQESQRDDHFDDVPTEIPEPRMGKRVWKAKSYGYDFQLYLVEGSRDQVRSQYTDHNTHIVIVLRRILEPIMKLLMLRLVLL
ncbi:hypothetical protein Tco_1018849 [Tanacetum coccineum]|uniref:Retroviral polymerase SH3-like domain-containing protein n=1 Tax=Tanacetum coccineum TaxID=301880 RepID=A0ABQ5FWL7_9ASTR